MKSKFTSKILFVTVTPVITTAIILSSILIYGRISDFNKHIDERGQNLVNYLAPISEFGVFSNNFNYMDTTFRHAINLPDIAAIYVLNDKQEKLATRINSKWLDIDIDNINTKNYRIFRSTIHQTKTIIDDIDLEYKSEVSSSSIGYVVVIMSLAESIRIKHRIIKDSIFITLISSIATILIALVFARTITKPIMTIRNGVNSIKNGDLHYRIPTDFHDELSELAQGINNMSTSLEIAQIKEKQRAEDALFIEKTKAQITLEAIGEGVITTNTHGLINYVNPAAEFLTGYTLSESLNKPLSDIFKIKSSNDRYIEFPISKCINDGLRIHHDSEYMLVKRDKTEFVIRETATPLIDKNHNIIGSVLVFNDITNIKKMSDILSYQASHDDLTGLFNRRAFEEKLLSITESIYDDESYSLCYIDLDQFKSINNTLGHVAGDKLLKNISDIIKNHIRENDVAARLGGDEFALIFIDCDEIEAKNITDKIKSSVADYTFQWESHYIKITFSAGIVAILPDNNLVTVMINADKACRLAKDQGRDSIYVYSSNGNGTNTTMR